jgi:hypothetical protein
MTRTRHGRGALVTRSGPVAIAGRGTECFDCGSGDLWCRGARQVAAVPAALATGVLSSPQ